LVSNLAERSILSMAAPFLLAVMLAGDVGFGVARLDPAAPAVRETAILSGDVRGGRRLRVKQNRNSVCYSFSAANPSISRRTCS
jgi:hypothetical protein